MRALVFWALGGIGGIQRMYPFTINALQRCGFLVDVATAYDIDLNYIEKYHGVTIKDVRVIKFPEISCHRFYPLICESLNSTIASTKFLSLIGKNYDLVYIDTLYVGPFFKRSLPRHNGIIYYLHAPIERPRPVVLMAKPHRMFLLAFQAMGTNYELLRRARIVFANSRFTAYVTEKALGIRPTVLYPPIDVDLVSKYRSRDRENALVSFARFSSAKGHEQAIRVVKELVREGINVRAYIMGSASDLATKAYVVKLMRMTRDLGVERNVEFVVNPSIYEVYKVLGKSKVFIHVREHEPFGIVIAEAMAAGTIPIVPKSGAPWHDIVEYGKYGIGYSSFNELINAVKYIINEGYDEYHDKVITKVQEFSVDIFNNKFCDIAKRILRNN